MKYTAEQLNRIRDLLRQNQFRTTDDINGLVDFHVNKDDMTAIRKLFRLPYLKDVDGLRASTDRGNTKSAKPPSTGYHSWKPPRLRGKGSNGPQ